MPVKNTLRALAIGCGVKAIDVADYNIACRGGIVAHDFAVAFRNVSGGALSVAIADATAKDPKADGTFNALRIGMITPLAAEATLAHGGWRTFRLGSATTFTVVPSGDPEGIVATATGKPAAETYYVVEVLADTPCTMELSENLAVVQNPGLLAAGAIPVGRTAFVIYSTANTESTITFSSADEETVNGIATADLRVFPITDWALGKLVAQF